MTKRTILITGATSGIGRDAALALARRGHRVFATGRNAALLAELEAKAAGTRLETLRLDVTKADSIEAARRAVETATSGKGIDVLVNNAGYGVAGPIDVVSDEDVRAQFETNVFGLLSVTRAFVPGLRAKGRGRVINIGSIGGRVTFPLFGVYHATKYAVEAISDAMRMELSAFGIEVALVEPGPIRTNFADRTVGLVNKYATDDSPYAAIFARVDEIKRRSDALSADVSVVTRAIVHAAEARRPRVRYLVPGRERLTLLALKGIPTRLADFVMTRVLGLTARGLARTEQEVAVQAS